MQINLVDSQENGETRVCRAITVRPRKSDAVSLRSRETRTLCHARLRKRTQTHRTPVALFPSLEFRIGLTPEINNTNTGGKIILPPARCE